MNKYLLSLLLCVFALTTFSQQYTSFEKKELSATVIPYATVYNTH